MDPILQVLVPVATLILGYLLNVWGGGIESQRSEKRRRIADKEKAYAQISAKLHDLFETYRIITLNTNLHRLASSRKYGNQTIVPPTRPHDYEADIETIGKKYDALKDLVFEQSLYLEPRILQKLVDLPLIDLRNRVELLNENPSPDAFDQIRFEEQHIDQLWSKTKEIMSEMREELGFSPYPDELMKMWR